MKIYRRKVYFMYLIKFDEEGKKISAVPLILADDWGGVEKLKNEGYIEVSDEDWNYYTGNCGDGDNDTGYIRDSITGKPISAPARVITLEERVNALKAEYENNIKAIDEAIPYRIKKYMEKFPLCSYRRRKVSNYT